jgi:hypothetical protein
LHLPTPFRQQIELQPARARLLTVPASGAPEKVSIHKQPNDELNLMTIWDHSGWLEPTGKFIPRGEDHFTSLPRERTGTAPSPRVDSIREGTMRGYSRPKQLGDQMNVDCLAEKIPLVEAWVRKNTDVNRIQFHIWS